MVSIGKVIQDAISSKTEAEIKKSMKPILSELKAIRKELASVAQAVEKGEPLSVGDRVTVRRPVKKTKAAKKRAKNTQKKATASQPTNESGKVITGNAIKALRTKLGMSQADFAKLVKVSAPSITLWEQKKGKALQFRKETRPHVEAVMAQSVESLKAPVLGSKAKKKVGKKVAKKTSKRASGK